MPEDLRLGQNLFNLLEWLHKEKGFTNDQSHRMADPFYFTDDDFDKYAQEYMDFLETQRQSH